MDKDPFGGQYFAFSNRRHTLIKVLYWDRNPWARGARRWATPWDNGMKNWLFCDTPAGAHASAAIHSVIETAKANGHEPCWYPRFLLDRLVSAKSTEDVEKPLPQYLRPDDLARGT